VARYVPPLTVDLLAAIDAGRIVGEFNPSTTMAAGGWWAYFDTAHTMNPLTKPVRLVVWEGLADHEEHQELGKPRRCQVVLTDAGRDAIDKAGSRA
jgi:hypothetical protein